MEDFSFTSGYNRVSIFYVIKDFMRDVYNQKNLTTFAEMATLLNEDVNDFMDSITDEIDNMFPVGAVISSINPSDYYLNISGFDISFDFDIILDVDEDIISFDDVVAKIEANKSMLIYGGTDKTSAKNTKFYTKKDLKNRIMKILGMDYDYLEDKAREIFKTISSMDYISEFEKFMWRMTNDSSLLADLINAGKGWDEFKDENYIIDFDDKVDTLLSVLNKFAVEN